MDGLDAIRTYVQSGRTTPTAKGDIVIDDTRSVNTAFAVGGRTTRVKVGPCMWEERVARGVRVGRQRVRNPMEQHGIRARHKCQYLAQANSNHKLAIRHLASPAQQRGNDRCQYHRLFSVAIPVVTQTHFFGCDLVGILEGPRKMGGAFEAN